MRAAVARKGELVVDDVADPQPGPGEALVAVKACGICGSDLHALHHADELVATSKEIGAVFAFDPAQDYVMGHEFSAEVLDTGPDTIGPAPGTLVTSIPIMLTMTGVQDLVYSNDLPAGYSERMLLSAPMLLEVPNGLEAGLASLTEPMAVGLHAVNKANIEPGTGALVLGCGPVGLAVVAALRRRGIEPIVASDFSPARRSLALEMGAHAAIDPAEEAAFTAWAREGGARPLVVFEAIGVPGIIDEAFRAAPPQTRIVVVGVCMERDAITPFFGIGKELNVQFVLGYDPMEFAESLRAIAEGEVDVRPMITGRVGLDGVPDAFSALANPDEHCKILVTPDASRAD
jgi:threonine dehydrogenase-like Zn-dependent dehydrogenase